MSHRHHHPHHLIIDSLRRLLLCRRRGKAEVDNHSSSRSPSSSNSPREDVVTRAASSSDSTRCHPRPNRSEKRRRRKWQTAGMDYRSILDNAKDDTESLRTLCSGSTDGGVNTPAVSPTRESTTRRHCSSGESAAADTTADSSQRSSAKQPAVVEKRGSFAYRAEICHLEQSSDHLDAARDATSEGYILARSDDLVVTEYRTESVKSDKKPKVVNNALVSYQRQLNAELCEVNCHSGSSAVQPNEAVQVSTNLSNMALHQPNSCAASHQQPTLRVHAMSEGSEPRTTCASVTASEPGISCEPLPSGCWPCGDISEATAAAPGSVCKAPPPGAINNDEPHQYAMPVAQTNDNRREDSCKVERFGALSGDQCDRLCHGLRSNDLLDRYLAKRDISDTTRASHRQRCGQITAELMKRILQLSAEAAAEARADTAIHQKLRDSRSQPLSVTLAATAVTTAPHKRKARLTAKWSQQLPPQTNTADNIKVNGSRRFEHQSR